MHQARMDASGFAPATAAELAKSFKVEWVAELLATLASLGQARAAGDGRFAA